MAFPHAALLLFAFAPSSAVVPPPVQTPAPSSTAPATTSSEAAPVEAGTSEAAPVDAGTSEAAPVEAAPVEAAPSDASSGTPSPAAPTTVAPTVPPPTDASDLPPEPASGEWKPAEVSSRRPNRRGTLAGLGLGFVGCKTEECDFSDPEGSVRFAGGALGRLELGYRFQWIAPVVSTSLGGGPMRYSGDFTGLEGVMRFTNLDAGLLLFPMWRGRVDPYVGAHIGYARARVVMKAPGTDFRGTITYSRPGARITAGLGFFVGPYASLGPRFDISLPFAGEVCTELSGGGLVSESNCVDVSDVPEAYRDELPRWWSVTLNLHLVLPGITGG